MRRFMMSKGKGRPITWLCWHRGEVEVWLQPIRNLDARRGGWSPPPSGRFNPDKDPVLIVKETGLASEPV
jgi:hypothetical protein